MVAGRSIAIAQFSRLAVSHGTPSVVHWPRFSTFTFNPILRRHSLFSTNGSMDYPPNSRKSYKSEGVGSGGAIAATGATTRCSSMGISTSSSKSSSSGGSSSTEAYVSPYQNLFDRMHANRSTILGSVEDEYYEFEKEQEKRSRKLECGIPESKLRFYSSTWGRTLSAPHVMPKEHQVTLKINTCFLPLTAPEKEILREIVGKRLNDERHELRLSSNQFGSRIENKRHVVSMLDRIILSCQRMGKTLENNHESDNSSSSSSDEDPTKDHDDESDDSSGRESDTGAKEDEEKKDESSK